jgi:hypothetical protein
VEVRRPHARGYGDVVGRRRRVCGGQQLPHGVERVRYPPARYEYGGDNSPRVRGPPLEQTCVERSGDGIGETRS